VGSNPAGDTFSSTKTMTMKVTVVVKLKKSQNKFYKNPEGGFIFETRETPRNNAVNNSLLKHAKKYFSKDLKIMFGHRNTTKVLLVC
jgi:uncharacterized protein YggU (UPF0235/DUF167 family)